MSKVDLELVKMVLQRNELEPRLATQILEDIRGEAQAADDGDPTAPAVKKQFVIIVSDPRDELAGKSFVGWVLQVPEDAAPQEAKESLVRAAADYNTSRKGRRLPVRSVGEACEFLPARIAKEYNLWIKTREPVPVLRSVNMRMLSDLHCVGPEVEAAR